MFFKQIKDAEGCISYVFACKHTGEAAVVDPNHDLDVYLTLLNENNFKCRYVFDTHTHADHDSLAGELAGSTGAQLAMYENYATQRKAGQGFTKHQGVVRHLAQNAGITVDLALQDGTVLKVGDIEVKILHTPGHTSDSVSLFLHKKRLLLTGDMLMVGQCGRTDLPGGDSGELYRTLFERLAGVNDYVVVCPAHDYKGDVNSALGYERVNNLFFKKRTEEEFVAFAAETFGKLSPGDKIQCSIAPAVGAAPPLVPASGTHPLMGQMCTSMEYYFTTVPADWNLVSSHDLHELMQQAEAPLILDVRTPEEFAQGHIPDAVNIEVTELPRRVGELVSYLEKPVVTVCESAVRSAYAAMFLRGYGFSRVKTLDHGMYSWRMGGGPVVAGA